MPELPEVETIARQLRELVVGLDGGEALIVSMRMTGQLLFHENGAPEERFLRAVIRFADGTALHFADTRKFGRMAVVDAAVLGQGARPPTGRAPPGPRGDRLRVPLHESLGVEPL